MLKGGVLDFTNFLVLKNTGSRFI